MTSCLEIPEASGDVDEMWRILKDERKEIEEIRWIPVKDEREISEYMSRWSIRHFAQAAITPLATPEWRDRLDRRLAGPLLEEIPNGKFKPPEGCPPELLNFIHSARRPNEAKEVPFTMSFSHFRKFCMKQDEKKESSPSGLHYGHMRAVLWDERSLWIKYKLIELTYHHGILLRRWNTLRKVLISKKKRTFIQKFRNITLAEGDMQYLTNAIWSQALMCTISPIIHPNQNAFRGKVTQ